MASDCLTPEARRENAASLASALGIGINQAAEALDLRILVTADPSDSTAQQVADDVAQLLSRTVQRVARDASEQSFTVELVVGAAVPRSNAAAVYVDIREERAIIGKDGSCSGPAAEIPGIIGLLVACYASAATLYHALPSQLPFGLPDPLVVEFSQLGIEMAALARPIELGQAYLAGAGAIGNGLLWAARYLDLRGRLDIVDDDQVSPGNLNRQVWFDASDIGFPKAERLAARAASACPHLALVPRVSRMQNLPERSDGSWLRRLIVAVDSRRARRSLQNEFPKEVFDASTTDIREIVLHYHRQPTQNACLSCIYEPDHEEFSREQHIADHLGVSIADVRSERISPQAANAIVLRFPSLLATEVIGVAYDTLFKRLCSEGQLTSLAGKRVVAPFAFVSVLAGIFLAFEIIRRVGERPTECDDNYWRISPWHAPLGRRRTLRPKQPGCAFCGDPVLIGINTRLWT